MLMLAARPAGTTDYVHRRGFSLQNITNARGTLTTTGLLVIPRYPG